MEDRMLGTADIPQQYWTHARLVGKIPFFACQKDPRVSYCLYVPPDHYAAATSTTTLRLPLVVHVHGSLRRAELCRDSLIDSADRMGAAILAPLFPAGLDGPNDAHGYKFLSGGPVTPGTRYDKILLSILDEVAVRWPRINTEKIFMCGYSGGGQFALRFFYIHPDRLAAVSIGAPGLITRLDATKNWPLGIKDVEKYFNGKTVDIARLQQVSNIQLLIGSEDTAEVNGGLWRIMHKITPGRKPQNAGDLPKEIQNRLAAIKDLHEEMQCMGISADLVVVDGVAHEFVPMIPPTMQWLERQLQSQQWIGGEKTCDDVKSI